MIQNNYKGLGLAVYNMLTSVKWGEMRDTFRIRVEDMKLSRIIQDDAITLRHRPRVMKRRRRVKQSGRTPDREQCVRSRNSRMESSRTLQYSETRPRSAASYQRQVKITVGMTRMETERWSGAGGANWHHDRNSTQGSRGFRGPVGREQRNRQDARAQSDGERRVGRHEREARHAQSERNRPWHGHDPRDVLGNAWRHPRDRGDRSDRR